MKNYKKYEKAYIGGSDVSALTVTAFGESGLTANILRFGSDGEYHAYIVDDECEIPSHYALALHVSPYAAEFHGLDGSVTHGTPSGWAKIYDDSGLVYEARFTNGLNIYRAGERGCIVQIL